MRALFLSFLLATLALPTVGWSQDASESPAPEDIDEPVEFLSLAAVLKSPVFGLDDGDLMDLGLDRPGSRSLWRTLCTAATANPRYQAAETLLRAWRAEAGYRRPADFYAGLLARDGVRRRMVARLGAEADEILDEFLAFALAQERTGVTDIWKSGNPEFWNLEI